MQEEPDLIQIGSEGAVCVTSANDSGVVYMGRKSLVCGLCKHQKSKCVHVQYILDTLNQDDIPPVLEHIASVLKMDKHSVSRDSRYGLQSTKPIPFHLPDTLKKLFKMRISKRFCMKDGTCHLKDDVQGTPCTRCGFCAWSADSKKSDTVIIMSNRIFPGISK